MLSVGDIITEDNLEFSELILERVTAFKMNHKIMENKLMQVVIMYFYILNSVEIPRETKARLMQIISHLICEEHTRQNESDLFDYGLYGDLLFKTYGLFISLDIDRFLKYSDPIYSMVAMGKENTKEFPKKVISYALFIDFMLRYPFNQIFYRGSELTRSDTQSKILRVDKVLELLIHDMVCEPNVYLRCLIIKGMVRMLLYSPHFFKGFKIDRLEVTALLILQWHNQNLRHSSFFSLTTLQTLSFYFVSQASRSPEKLNEIGMSFLLLVETVFMIVRSNEALDSKVIKLPYNSDGFLESLFKTFISLSSFSQNKSMGRPNRSRLGLQQHLRLPHTRADHDFSVRKGAAAKGVPSHVQSHDPVLRLLEDFQPAHIAHFHDVPVGLLQAVPDLLPQHPKPLRRDRADPGAKQDQDSQGLEDGAAESVHGRRPRGQADSARRRRATG